MFFYLLAATALVLVVGITLLFLSGCTVGLRSAREQKAVDAIPDKVDALRGLANRHREQVGTFIGFDSLSSPVYQETEKIREEILIASIPARKRDGEQEPYKDLTKIYVEDDAYCVSTLFHETIGEKRRSICVLHRDGETDEVLDSNSILYTCNPYQVQGLHLRCAAAIQEPPVPVIP